MEFLQAGYGLCSVSARYAALLQRVFPMFWGNGGNEDRSVGKGGKSSMCAPRVVGILNAVDPAEKPNVARHAAESADDAIAAERVSASLLHDLHSVDAFPAHVWRRRRLRRQFKSDSALTSMHLRCFSSLWEG